MLPILDWSISFGNMFTIISMVATIVYIHSKQDAKLTILSSEVVNLKEKQDALSEAFIQIGGILTKLAVQDTRMSLFERIVDELRHGHGFIDYPKGEKRTRNA